MNYGLDELVNKVNLKVRKHFPDYDGVSIFTMANNEYDVDKTYRSVIQDISNSTGIVIGE